MPCLTDHFPCVNDCCKRGEMYCDKLDQRCPPCSDVQQLCGTQKMPLECDLFCHNLLTEHNSYSGTSMAIIVIICLCSLVVILGFLLYAALTRQKWLLEAIQKLRSRFKRNVSNTDQENIHVIHSFGPNNGEEKTTEKTDIFTENEEANDVSERSSLLHNPSSGNIEVDSNTQSSTSLSTMGTEEEDAKGLGVHVDTNSDTVLGITKNEPSKRASNYDGNPNGRDAPDRRRDRESVNHERITQTNLDRISSILQSRKLYAEAMSDSSTSDARKETEATRSRPANPAKRNKPECAENPSSNFATAHSAGYRAGDYGMQVRSADNSRREPVQEDKNHAADCGVLVSTNVTLNLTQNGVPIGLGNFPLLGKTGTEPAASDFTIDQHNARPDQTTPKMPKQVKSKASSNDIGDAASTTEAANLNDLLAARPSCQHGPVHGTDKCLRCQLNAMTPENQGLNENDKTIATNGSKPIGPGWSVDEFSTQNTAVA